jgi:hypothetical protein
MPCDETREFGSNPRASLHSDYVQAEISTNEVNRGRRSSGSGSRRPRDRSNDVEIRLRGFVPGCPWDNRPYPATPPHEYAEHVPMPTFDTGRLIKSQVAERIYQRSIRSIVNSHNAGLAIDRFGFNLIHQ